MSERSGWAVVTATGRVAYFYEADSRRGLLATMAAAEQSASVLSRRCAGARVELDSSASPRISAFLSGAR